MILAVRMLSLDENLRLPLVMPLYIGSPASVNNTGQGMAETILKALNEFGFDAAMVNSRLSGGCYDGQLLICKVIILGTVCNGHSSSFTFSYFHKSIFKFHPKH